MAEPETKPDTSRPARPVELGLFGRRESQGAMGGTEALAAALSALWLLGTTIFFVFTARRSDATAALNATRFVMTLIAIFMPVALIWVAATAARASRIMREESTRLQSAISALRQSYIQQQQAGIVSQKGEIERRLAEIAATQQRLQNAIANLGAQGIAAEVAARQAAGASAGRAEEDQPSLALGTPAEELAPPLSKSDYISALNFPESPDDKPGFAILRRALQDRGASQLVRAAQDVLTLLSQDGIYMDDLSPDHAPAALWRRFARGERGRELSNLGGIRDRSCLALAAGRMREDTVFRDSVHHFLRLFDKGFAEFEKTASDAEIAALADTRSARAFMLLGRVAGTFD